MQEHQQQMREYIKNLRIRASSLSTTLIIMNDEMKDIFKIVKSLEYSGLLLKGVRETVQNEAREKKEDFLACY